MCGILAYYNVAGLSRKELDSCMSALQKLKHRGPDGEGITLVNIHTGKFVNLQTNETPEGIKCEANSLSDVRESEFHLFLGHRRLKIIDLSLTGHQPMTDIGENLVITFNGEIYNYPELKEELIKLKHNFKSHSDTEVILESYKEWGTGCFNRFNGMWSMVIWDKIKRELVVSNDRYGIKPLYYCSSKNELIFSSEIKPFFSFPSRIKEYNMTVIHTYINHGYINYDGNTPFNEIKKVLNAHYSKIKLNDTPDIKQNKYYEIVKAHLNSGNSQHDIIEEFKCLIKDAVKLTLRSDVPLGVAISGGLDSSYVLYETSALLKNDTINTYSAIFPGNYGDESEFISIALQGLNCRSHFVKPMEQFTFEDFEKQLVSQEYPVQDFSYYADRSVSRHVKETGVSILLNGQGADELFAGYHHHFYKYCSDLILKGRIAEYKRNIKEFCSLKNLPRKQTESIVYNNVKLRLKSIFTKPHDLPGKWAHTRNLDELLRIDMTECTLPAYLEGNDRNSMAFSVESRLPFLDYRLVDFAVRLPSEYKIRDGWQKWILREAGDLLPDAIRYRKDKKGFSTPKAEWTKRYEDKLRENLPYLDKIGMEKKESFRYYTLALWLKHFPL